jgi:hypothetical protein
MSADDRDDYLFDKAGDADPEVARLESVLATMRYAPSGADRIAEMEARERLARARRRRRWTFSASLVLAAIVILAFGLTRLRATNGGPSLAVKRLDGRPRIGHEAVDARARLGVGAWLETDGASRAEIELADLGHVTVAPGSRLRLVATAPNEQRLELAQGGIDAKVFAPPRIFVVDTPTARAIDLGCAYHLEVLPAGGTILRVTSGAVELAGGGRESHVPAGASCETRPLLGPGLPTFDDASDAFKALVRRVDFDPGDTSGALAEMLATARPRDTLTLWHMVFRGDAQTRLRVLARVTELVPPAPGIDLASGGPPAYQRYQDQLMTRW